MFPHPLFSGPVLDARTLLLKDLRCRARIGVHQHEQGREQMIALNLAVRVSAPRHPVEDRLDRVLDYELLRTSVRHLIAERHYALQETLCEAIVQACLALPEVQAVYVAIAKLEAFDDCEAAGCERLVVRA